MALLTTLNTCDPGIELHAECIRDQDCTEPNPCQLPQGATCIGGACSYPPVLCTQSQTNCRERAPACDPGLMGGTCSGQDCCAFAPIWDGSATTPAPPCPLAGEDPNDNLTVDASETWSGRCNTDGLCDTCEDVTVCFDGNLCTYETCVMGRCVSDPDRLLGDTCGTEPDHICTPQGSSVTCCENKDGDDTCEATDCDDDPTQCGDQCSPSLTESPTDGNCADTFDNDCDSLVDAADPDCN